MDKKTINVLVFPAGEINAVELHDALATCVNIKLFGASSVERHGSYIFENYIGDIPFINDPAFFEAFNALLDEHQIDVIFPTHDTIAPFFAEHQGRINARVVAGDQKTSEICRDKQKTYDLFADCAFVPQVYADAFTAPLPLFIKPKIGQGSVGAKKIDSTTELAGIDLNDYVAAEYLPGQEYTVDCLTDRRGVLQVVSPRSRDRTLGGVSVAGRTQPLTDEIKAIADTINERLAFKGLWFFQIKQNAANQWKLLEISTRCAGTMCLTRARGINLPLLSVYTAMDIDVAPIANDYQVTMDRTLISRYKIDYAYSKVYLDFDDTVIIRGKVHLYAMMFIYQCRNRGVPVYLITKHANEIYETLHRYGIDKDLFAEIIHLRDDEHKIGRIAPEAAVFIDNAFQERKLVYDKYHIPVFDVDGLEVLLDWRT